jgi:hypothetical protein
MWSATLSFSTRKFKHRILKTNYRLILLHIKGQHFVSRHFAEDGETCGLTGNTKVSARKMKIVDFFIFADFSA